MVTAAETRLYEPIRRWWAVLSVAVSVLSGFVGIVVGGTWQVAAYDNRLNAVNSMASTQATNVAALSVRVSGVEALHAQMAERQSQAYTQVAGLQQQFSRVNDRLDLLRDSIAGIRESQAGLAAQMTFITRQQPAPVSAR